MKKIRWMNPKDSLPPLLDPIWALVRDIDGPDCITIVACMNMGSMELNKDGEARIMLGDKGMVIKAWADFDDIDIPSMAWYEDKNCNVIPLSRARR